MFNDSFNYIRQHGKEFMSLSFLQILYILHTWSPRIIYLYIRKGECMYVYVCMFRHNYLSVNGIVSFPSFTWLYRYKEEYKHGEMWHSAQRAEISKKVCMFQPGRCQVTGTWLISAENNNEELLIARQRFRDHGYIDGNNWSRRLKKESYRQLQGSSRRESTIYPGNAGLLASKL
jgi:hypothetical protein